jgi:hypothetical protein
MPARPEHKDLRDRRDLKAIWGRKEKQEPQGRKAPQDLKDRRVTPEPSRSST